MTTKEPIWNNLEEYLDNLDDGTELKLMLWARGHVQANFLREYPKKHEKTVFATYTTPTNFSGSVELFRFKIKKESKKKHDRFPFKLTEFEINAGFFKGKFERTKQKSTTRKNN